MFKTRGILSCGISSDLVRAPISPSPRSNVQNKLHRRPYPAASLLSLPRPSRVVISHSAKTKLGFQTRPAAENSAIPFTATPDSASTSDLRLRHPTYRIRHISNPSAPPNRQFYDWLRPRSHERIEYMPIFSNSPFAKAAKYIGSWFRHSAASNGSISPSVLRGRELGDSKGLCNMLHFEFLVSADRD
jgi:hypothetical protein